MMQQYQHILHGCKPEPLASYLKALAVLRLVSQQVDTNAKACWTDEGFVLHTRLSKDELLNFFVNDYAPTPLVSPWNKGSIFFPSPKKDHVVNVLMSSDVARFAKYRKVVDGLSKNSYVKKMVDKAKELKTTEHELTELENSKQDKEKQSLLKERKALLEKELKAIKENVQTTMRSFLPEDVLDWADTAYTFVNDGDIRRNPILGTGGNEGNLDYSFNFLQRVIELFIQGEITNTQLLASNSLFDSVTSDFTEASIGQLDPGRAGGYNQGVGIEAKDFKINPWDFILMLEGAVLLTSSVYKRHNSDNHGWAAIPFAVTHSHVGYTSSMANEKKGRSEIWMPLWKSPTKLQEIAYVFAEARCDIGRRKARNGLDFSRAISSLGVDRGFSSFTRFSILWRRGKDSQFAVPAGRLPVRYNSSISLLDDLDVILRKLDGFPSTPTAFTSARRRIDKAMYTCAVKGDSAAYIKMVRALGRMEAIIALRGHSRNDRLDRPLTGLRIDWISHIDNNSPEVRIAAALASIHATEKVGAIRCNMADVNPANPCQWNKGKGQTQWMGGSLVQRLAGVLSRRIMDAGRLNTNPHAPIQSRLILSPWDIVPFLMGQTDDHLTEELLWGFTLINWKDSHSEEPLRKLQNDWMKPLSKDLPIPRSYAAIKLLFMPKDIQGKRVRMEPRILPLLHSGRAKEAVELAVKRLRISDLKPLPVESGSWLIPERLYAALLIPTRSEKLESLVVQAGEDKQ